MMCPIPNGYSLSRNYTYRKEVVSIYTDGDHYIFASGELQPDGEVLWTTVSAPALIGNAPAN